MNCAKNRSPTLREVRKTGMIYCAHKSLAASLYKMVAPCLARAYGKSKKVLHYNRCEHCVCVCVCVCVCKVANSCDTTKQSALKDAEKFALFCSAVIPVWRCTLHII